MPTNGAHDPVAHTPVHFGDFVGDLPAWLEPEPETAYTIREISRAARLEDAQLELLDEEGHVILRGDGAAIAARMRAPGQATPGALTKFEFIDGRVAVFINRTDAEKRAGKPACVWRSDQAV